MTHSKVRLSRLFTPNIARHMTSWHVGAAGKRSANCGAQVAAFAAIMVTASLAGCGGQTNVAGGQIEPSPVADTRTTTGSETTLSGYVVRLSKTDTIRVGRAAVWTVPASEGVFSDSSGAWTISNGLSQRQYRVWASSEDLKGKTALIPARVSKTVDGIVIMLGADETAWPPDNAFQRIAPPANRGPGVVRMGAP